MGKFAAVALVLALSGCGTTSAPSAVNSSSPTPSATASPTPTSTSTPTPTPTSAPTPVAVVRPSLAELVLSFDGLGPLRLGDDPNLYDPETSIVEREDNACEEPGRVDWRAVYVDAPLSATTPGITVNAFAVAERIGGGGVVGIQVFSPKIKTTAGIGVGSSLASLKLAYPHLEFHSTNYAYDRYSVVGHPGTLYFDLINGGFGAPVGVVSRMMVISAELNPGIPSFHKMGDCG